MKKVYSNLSEAGEHLNEVIKTAKSYGHDTCVVDVGCLAAVCADWEFWVKSFDTYVEEQRQKIYEPDPVKTEDHLNEL